MKYILIPIFARNVQFSPSTKQFLKELEESTNVEKIKNWIKTKLTKWLINEYKGTPHKRYLKGDEDWVLKALERGDEVFDVKISQKDSNMLKRVVSRLNTNNDIQKILMKIDVPTLIEKISSIKDNTEGIKIIHQYSDGFKWIALLKEDAIHDEGVKMNNCLQEESEYHWSKKVKEKKSALFSLRDGNNKPHINIELELAHKEVKQIRGKQNKPVTDKYRKYLLDFLKKNYIKYKEVNLSELVANGYFIEKNNIIDLSKTSSLIIHSDLVFNHIDITRKWPDNVIIEGAMECHDMAISEWPKSLTTESLSLMSVSTDSLPKELIAGSVSLNGVHGLSSLPQKMNVENLFIFSAPGLKKLPDNLILTNLVIDSLDITTLPKNLLVEKGLFIINSNIKSLPQSLVVEGTLYLHGSKVMENIKKGKVKIPKGVNKVDEETAEWGDTF